MHVERDLSLSCSGLTDDLSIEVQIFKWTSGRLNAGGKLKFHS